MKFVIVGLLVIVGDRIELCCESSKVSGFIHLHGTS